MFEALVSCVRKNFSQERMAEGHRPMVLADAILQATDEVKSADMGLAMVRDAMLKGHALPKEVHEIQANDWLEYWRLMLYFLVTEVLRQDKELMAENDRREQ